MNILILGSKCFKKADAGGICSRNLQKEFLNSEDLVYLLGYSLVDEKAKDIKVENCEYEFFYKRKQSKTNTIQKRLNSVKRCFIPNVDYALVNRYYNIAKDIVKKENINIVISVYYPMEALIVLDKLKKEFPHLKTIEYEVDSAIDVMEYTSRLSKLHIKAEIKYLSTLYKDIDYIFVMKSHINNFQQIYKDYDEKTIVFDVPFLVEEINDTRKNKKTIDFLYTGFLDKEIYSPDPIFHFFELNKEKTNWRLHFISRGNCEEYIKLMSEKDNRIIQHGYTEFEKTKEEIGKADVLLSIEYKNKPASIPSKVFNYYSSGKMVLHFYSGDYNYFCKEYIDEYSLGLAIKTPDISKNNDEIVKIINKNYKKRVCFNKVYDKYYMNTPKYSVELIRKLSK